MHRLLGDLRAAAGEGQEEMGLEQRTLPIHRHHRLPPVHSYFLFGSETNGQQKGSPISRCWASSGPTEDCREHGKGANTCLGGTFLGDQPIRDEGGHKVDGVEGTEVRILEELGREFLSRPM